MSLLSTSNPSSFGDVKLTDLILDKKADILSCFTQFKLQQTKAEVSIDFNCIAALH